MCEVCRHFCNKVEFDVIYFTEVNFKLEIGYISARVYTSDAELPIEGALFSVTSLNNNVHNLIGMRISDENGKTEPIEVESPDSSLSQSPGNSKPYTTVNIRVDHPDFKTFQVEGVQVFAGETSIQDAPMIPTTYDIDYNQKSDIYDIEPNNL